MRVPAEMEPGNFHFERFGDLEMPILYTHGLVIFAECILYDLRDTNGGGRIHL